MRRAASLFGLAALCSLGALPAQADLSATGTRLSVGSGAPRFYMTYGRMEAGEVFAPITQELKRLQVSFVLEADTCTVLHKGTKVATWPIIRSRDEIPATMTEPFVLNLGSSTYVPIKQLAKLVPIDIAWDARGNLLALTAGSAKPAPVATAPASKGASRAPQVSIRRREDASPMPATAPDPSATGSIELRGVALEWDGARLRVRVQASAPVRSTMLMLKAPARIVFDFPDARWVPSPQLPTNVGPVRNVRTGHPADGQARLVLEVTSTSVKIAGVEVETEQTRTAQAGTGPASLSPTLEKTRKALEQRGQSRTGQRVASARGSRGGNLFLPPPAPVQPLLDFSLLPEARNAWQYIIIHHSASPSGSAAAFDRLHRGKGWDGLAYHFVITNGKGGLDGGLEVSPRWTTQKHGAHAGALPATTSADFRNGFNEFGIGICLVGNFERKQPTEQQLATLAELIRELRAEFNIPEDHILGHGTVKGTACPGGSFPWARLYGMMGLPAPQHLHRHPANLTVERCPWCQEQHLQK
jgi:hypothetical protein